MIKRGRAGRSGRWALRAGALISLSLVISGCDGAREAFGLARNSPDEFAVASRAPLSLPPNFNLRPPTPGAPRPQEVSPRTLAQGAIGQGDDGVGRAQSTAESAFVSQAAARGVEPEIRRLVDLESADLLRADESFVDTLLFWREPAAAGQVVDAVAESQRLASNTALGQPINEGEVPTIRRRETRGLLEDLEGFISF